MNRLLAVSTLFAMIRTLAEAQTIAVAKEFTIGAADGPPEYAFGQIWLLAPASSGAFYLFDASDVQIRRYDNRGRFLGHVGRSGAGPGEYRSVVAMAMHGDSVLLVYDPLNRRLAVFDSAGRYRRHVSLAKISTFSGERALVINRNGLMGIRTSVGGGEREGLAVPSQYIRMRLDGTIVDSLPVPSAETEGWPFVVITADGPRWSFPAQTVFAPLPDGGLATARTTSYRVTVSPPDRPPIVIERADRPIRIEGAERAEWEAFIRFSATRPEPRPPSPIPALKPLIRGLTVDDAGRIWVHRYGPAVKRAIPPRPAGDRRPQLTFRETNGYDVFDSRGAFLGTVTLPPDTMLLAIQGDRLYVRREAAGGEHLIERLVMMR